MKKIFNENDIRTLSEIAKMFGYDKVSYSEKEDDMKYSHVISFSSDSCPLIEVEFMYFGFYDMELSNSPFGKKCAKFRPKYDYLYTELDKTPYVPIFNLKNAVDCANALNLVFRQLHPEFESPNCDFAREIDEFYVSQCAPSTEKENKLILAIHTSWAWHDRKNVVYPSINEMLVDGFDFNSLY